jgi:hypothetical protein
MAYTEADLTAVRAEMKAARAVSFADRSVTRRSMEELKALEADILRELSETVRTRKKQTHAVATKGF